MLHQFKILKNVLAVVLLFAVGGFTATRLSWADDTTPKAEEKKDDEKKEDSKKDEDKEAAKEAAAKKREALQKRMKQQQDEDPVPEGFDPLKAPEGDDVEELSKYVKYALKWQPKTQQFTQKEVKTVEGRKKYDSAKEAENAQRKNVYRVVLPVVDKILASANLPEKERITKARIKMQLMSALGGEKDPAMRDQYRKYVEGLISDADPMLAKQAKNSFFYIRLARLIEDNPVETPQTLAKEASEIIKAATEKLNPIDLNTIINQANSAANYMEMCGEYELAINLHNEFIEFLKSDAVGKLPHAFEPGIKNQIKSTEKDLERCALLNKPAELKGKLVNGEDFDISAYKGKVVLIDFWATWCPPCREELPNVVENYKKYHDKGFEVVGISIDSVDTKDILLDFLKTKEISWVQIHSDDDAADFWDDPRIAEYHVNGIPATFLVDKEGKIVHLNVRGKRLGKLLEKMVGKG